MTAQTENPPSPPASIPENAEGGFHIFLRFQIPKELWPMETVLTQINIIPLTTLAEFLTLDLAGHGIKTTINYAGSLNEGIVSLVVADVHPALARVQDVLKRVTLTSWVSIYYFDDRELIFRPVTLAVFDDGSIPLTVEILREENDRYKAANERSMQTAQWIIARCQAYLAKPTPPPDPGNPS